MTSRGAMFNWTKIAAELRSAPWEIDEENRENEIRTVWLGTWLGCSPSGKVYQPFACSNVDGDCPVCGGEGKRREPRTGRRARKRAARRGRDFAKAVIKRENALRDGYASYLRRVRKYRSSSVDESCPACAGSGSISAEGGHNHSRAVSDKLRGK